MSSHPRDRKIIPLPARKSSDEVEQARALLERLWERVDPESQHDLVAMLTTCKKTGAEVTTTPAPN